MTSEIVVERGSESILGTAASTQFQPRLAPPPMRPAPPPIDPATFTAPVPAARPQPNALHTLFAAQQPQPSRRKKKSKIVGFIKTLFVLAVLGGIGFAVFGFATGRFGASDSDLPTFSAPRPIYGTATVELVTQGVDPSIIRLVTNSDSSTVYMAYLPESPTTPQLQAMLNDHQRFLMQPNDPIWALQDDLGTSAATGVQQLTGVTIFADYVPSFMTDYTTVDRHEKVEIDGRSLDRYDLMVQTGKVRMERPDAYAEWRFADTTSIAAPDYTERLVLYVDKQGIVWKIESWADDDPSATTSVSLVSYSVEEFAPNFPTTYRDDVRGGMVGA